MDSIGGIRQARRMTARFWLEQPQVRCWLWLRRAELQVGQVWGRFAVQAWTRYAGDVHQNIQMETSSKQLDTGVSNSREGPELKREHPHIFKAGMEDSF